MKELHDDYGRSVSGLRISVTQECNLNCIYCHREGQRKNNEIMSPERINEIVEVTSKLGVEKIKITGGEPLMREDICDIVSGISGINGIKDISMTSNGTLIHKFADRLRDAGLNRINVSLDTLDPAVYSVITGADSSCLYDVRRGLDSALKAGLYPVKLNMVVLKGLNENKIGEMIDFTRERGIILQLIELLDRESPLYYSLSDLEQDFERRASDVVKRRMHGRKKYLIEGAEVEVVRPHGSGFCMNCNRLRLTSDGRFKPCLLRDDTVEIGDVRDSFIEAVSRRRPFSVDQKQPSERLTTAF